MARLHADPPLPYTPLQFVLTLPFRPPEGLDMLDQIFSLLGTPDEA
eukprot:gene19404-47619_t